MAINMAKMEETRTNGREQRELELLVNGIISSTEGAHSYHKLVTRVSLGEKPLLDYFDDPSDVYLIYLPPYSSSLPPTLSEVLREARKLRDGNEDGKRDLISFLERRIEITDGIATSTELVKRIKFLDTPFIDIYLHSRQLHVRVPSTRLPDPFTDIIRLYLREGYGVVGYAPAGGFI